MTTPSDAGAAAPAAGRERRLHPLSWLFVLVQHLKQFWLPLLILLFTGRGDRNELWPLIGVGALGVFSLFQYFTYRYRVGAEGITIRSGLLQRTVRHIAFHRLHNVALQQSVLHRLFKVAEVRLESAGGIRPEASMRVLSIADAHALEHLVRRHAATAVDATADAAAADAPPLLALGPGELVRLGLISNRGMIVVGATIGLLAQSDRTLFAETIHGIGVAVMGWTRELHLEVAGLVVGAAVVLVLALVLLRLLSVALAFLTFHGFELREAGGRLHMQRGLLTRLRGSLPRGRIQAFDLHEGVLHRWFGRQSLRVDTMAVQNEQDGTSQRALAPLATPAHMEALVTRLLARSSWPPVAWKPLHPRAWVRRFVPRGMFWIVAAAALSWRFGPVGCVALAGVPLAALIARHWAQRTAYAVDDDLVAVRTGWLDRHWRFAETGKVQGLRLSRGPIDRRTGMASLLFDTAGATGGASPLAIRYLPEAEARALYARLADAIAPAPAAPVTRARTPASAAPAP
jgi:putative membrane protein